MIVPGQLAVAGEDEPSRQPASEENAATAQAAETSPPESESSIRDEASAERPKVPGVLRINARRRKAEQQDDGSTQVRVVQEAQDWNASETAIILCDMWADHYCELSAQRVDAMAPRMNRVVSQARELGVLIIHAPSGGVHYYEDTPFRLRMKLAPTVKPPVSIQGWCYLNPQKEAPLPIKDDVRPCDDPVTRKKPDSDRHQHPSIKITGFDGVSADGQEIYNVLHQEGIKNVVIMGVHANMCILGRPFGIRQMKYLGMNVTLARDLTDAMYDPREPPYVSHKRGTELVIEHIETYWCPSLLGRDLTHVLSGSDGP
jgi:nicotinamidase-related amidase